MIEREDIARHGAIAAIWFAIVGIIIAVFTGVFLSFSMGTDAWTVTGAMLVATAVLTFVSISRERRHAHYREERKVEADAERIENESRVAVMQAAAQLAAAQSAVIAQLPAGKTMTINYRSTSAWELSVIDGDKDVKLSGRMIEATAEALRDGVTGSIRDHVRKSVPVSNDHFRLLGELLEAEGITQRGKLVSPERLSAALDMWRVSGVASLPASRAVITQPTAGNK